MLHDVERLSEPHLDAAPSPRAAEPVGSEPLEDTLDIMALAAHDDPIVVEQQVQAEANPILLRHITARRVKRMGRQIQELPRGERWKRRLPEVCR